MIKRKCPKENYMQSYKRKQTNKKAGTNETCLHNFIAEPKIYIFCIMASIKAKKIRFYRSIVFFENR